MAPETRPIWTTARDEVFGRDAEWHDTHHATICRWREAYQNDFSARMDWTIKPPAEANHPPAPRLGHRDRITARPGQRVDLSARGSVDPDGDALSYHWFVYGEADTRPTSSSDSGLTHEIADFDQQNAHLVVKTTRVKRPGTGTMQMILTITDQGVPRLTRYKRVIIDVQS